MSSNYNTRPKAPEVLIEDKKIKLILKKKDGSTVKKKFCDSSNKR